MTWTYLIFVPWPLMKARISAGSKRSSPPIFTHGS
jgi:hypothetical protein